MRNRQVPRAEWFSFFQGFSKRHEDWLVTVHVVHPRLGSQVEVRNLPLEGVVADSQGKGPISIHMGRRPDDHVEHDVRDPVQVWVELGENGVEEALEIKSTDGTNTILQFRTSALPETVDGILHP